MPLNKWILLAAKLILSYLCKNVLKVKSNKSKLIEIPLYITVCCLMIISCWSCQFSTQTAEDLFQENFHPFPNLIVDLERSDLDSTYEVRSFLAYRENNFQLALDNFDQIPKLTNDNPLQLYRAVCYLALGDPATARKFLLPLADLNREYKDASNWYLALAALKSKNIPEAQRRLQLLTNRSTYIRNEAQVLMSKVMKLP